MERNMTNRVEQLTRIWIICLYGARGVGWQRLWENQNEKKRVPLRNSRRRFCGSQFTGTWRLSCRIGNSYKRQTRSHEQQICGEGFMRSNREAGTSCGAFSVSRTDGWVGRATAGLGNPQWTRNERGEEHYWEKFSEISDSKGCVLGIALLSWGPLENEELY